MFHQHFGEHRLLESLLELLQQFYLQIESIALDYKVFSWYQLKFSLNCLCCGKNTPTELFEKVLFMAPMAISHHLKILSSIPSVNDSCLIFKNMPVLFTSMENYTASKTLFDNAIYEIAEDETDEQFHSKNSCTNHDCRIGEYFFCEAIKVDLEESENKCQKNYFQKKKNQLSSTLSSTVCLLCTLFEDLGCAIDLCEKIANEISVLCSLDPRNYLFNGQEEGDYIFGQGIINEASSDDKEYLQLYELWCLFIYREFYKNLLVFLDEVKLITLGEKTSIQNRFCKLLVLHDDEKMHAFLMKLSNNTHSDTRKCNKLPESSHRAPRELLVCKQTIPV
jgi:hypothetical protein